MARISGVATGVTPWVDYSVSAISGGSRVYWTVGGTRKSGYSTYGTFVGTLTIGGVATAISGQYDGGSVQSGHIDFAHTAASSKAVSLTGGISGSTGWPGTSLSGTIALPARLVKPPTPSISVGRSGSTGRAFVLSASADSTATSWEWQRQYSGGAATSLGSTSSRSKTESGYAVGARVRFRVRAKNAAGTSGWSAWSAYFVTVPASPARPSWVRNSTDASKGTLSVAAAAEATTYEWGFRRDGSTLDNEWASTAGPSLNFTLTQLDTYFEFRVRARNAAGVSAWSAYSTQFVKAPAPPSGKPTVSWTRAASDPSRGTMAATEVARATSYEWSLRTRGSAVNDSWATSRARSRTFTLLNVDNFFEIRVRAVNSGGVGPWSDWSARFYKAPGKPNAPTLVPGDELITGTVTPIPYLQYGLEVERSSDGFKWTVGDGVSGTARNSFGSTDTTPGVKYRVRRFAGPAGAQTRVYSEWSAWSAGVTAIQAPHAPTVTAPAGSVSADGPLFLRWTFNSVDGTPQEQARFRWRPVGSDEWVTDTFGVGASHVVSLGGHQWEIRLTNTLPLWGAEGPTIEYQMATRGASPGWGPWSATRVVTLVTPPTVGFVDPLPGSVIHSVPFSVRVAYGQAEDLPMSGWRAWLRVDGAEVEALSGSGATDQLHFRHRYQSGTQLWVGFQAAANNVWGATTQATYDVEFIAPLPPVIVGAWDETIGGTQLAVSPTTYRAQQILEENGQLYFVEA